MALSLKYLVLVLLVVQNSTMTLSMRYTRIAEGPMYAISTAVIISEVLKLVVCVTMVWVEQGSVEKMIRQFRIDMRPLELLKVSVPSIIYVFQNNLLYFALSNLDTTVFQVVYQIKIITTALFSVAILGKQLSWIQWGSLVMLCAGASATQLSAQSDAIAEEKGNPVVGFIAVGVAAVLSGFAGVYFERILKTSDTSLWVRNVQMCLLGIPIAFMTTMYSRETEQILEHGPFYGYNKMVIFVIVVQAIGGLLVAAVVKYADNILKGFATSMSLICSLLVSIMIFDFKPSLFFTVGAILVNVATFIYMNCGITAVKAEAPVLDEGSTEKSDKATM